MKQKLKRGRGSKWGLVRMRSWLLWLWSSTLPPLLAASHPLRFHPPRHALDTTHKHACGFVLRFRHRFDLVRTGDRRVGTQGGLTSLSLRVAEAGASRRLLAGGEAIAETLFSRSDSATSCLMISPFSHFSALLGLPAHVFANIANTARAVTTPMKMNTKLIIYAAFLASWSKQVLRRNCALAGAAGRRSPRLLS